MRFHSKPVLSYRIATLGANPGVRLIVEAALLVTAFASGVTDRTRPSLQA